MLSQFVAEEAGSACLDLLPKVRAREWQSLGLNSGSPAPKVLHSLRQWSVFTAPQASYGGDRVVYKAKWQLAERVPLTQRLKGFATQS